MVLRKKLDFIKQELYVDLDQSDITRQMMIASADYSKSIHIVPFLPTADNYYEPGPRKKRRLDFLSVEEKVLYKKLKNREAAQNSRDKKKAYVTTLESTIAELKQENKCLNRKLETLTKENHQLKEKNATLEENVWQGTVGGAVKKPAVLSNPLQKDRAPSAVLPVPLQLHVMTIFCLMWMISAGLTTYPSLQTLMNCKNLPILWNKRLWNLRKRKVKKKIWWGRFQKAWNPVVEAKNIMVKNQTAHHLNLMM